MFNRAISYNTIKGAPVDTKQQRCRFSLRSSSTPVVLCTRKCLSKNSLKLRAIKSDACESEGEPCGRRNVLTAATVAAWLSCQQAKAKQDGSDGSSPGLAVPADPDAPKFFKTADGVKIQELATGSGTAVKSGDGVLFDYVLRR